MAPEISDVRDTPVTRSGRLPSLWPLRSPSSLREDQRDDWPKDFSTEEKIFDRKKMASVSGGTRWGGGVWINAQDMARFGYLWLRGGRWGSRQIAARLRQGRTHAKRSRP